MANRRKSQAEQAEIERPLGESPEHRPPYEPPTLSVCGTIEDLTGNLVRGGVDGNLAGTQNAG